MSCPKRAVWILVVGLLISHWGPAQSILPEPLCQLELGNLDSISRLYNLQDNPYILVLANTAGDKHTTAHILHLTHFRLRNYDKHIKVIWLFDEVLTKKNKNKQMYLLKHIFKLPLNDTNSVYIFNDPLYEDLWNQINDVCKYKSSLRIDAFSVYKNTIYDGVHLKTQSIDELLIPTVISNFNLEKKVNLPDSIVFSHLSYMDVLPSGNLIRVERQDNTLYHIDGNTGEMTTLWKYDYNSALQFFVNYMAWHDSVKKIALKMGLYPPYWNRQSFRLVKVRVQDSLLLLTATFEAPCPFEKDITFVNVEGEKKTLKTAHSWGYCAYGMFGIAKYKYDIDNSFTIEDLKWWAVPNEELPEPYNKYILSDQEEFVFTNYKVLFPTVNYDWKFDRTICFLTPIFCKIRYAFKKKFTPSVVSYHIDRSKQGFMEFDTIYLPYRKYRQFILGSESGGRFVSLNNKLFIFPTLLSFEYGIVGERKVSRTLDVIQNKKKKYLSILDLIRFKNKPGKLPVFIIDIDFTNRKAGIVYYRFGKIYLHFYDRLWRSTGVVSLDQVPEINLCLSSADKLTDKIACVLGKMAIDIKNRRLYYINSNIHGNELCIYRF